MARRVHVMLFVILLTAACSAGGGAGTVAPTGTGTPSAATEAPSEAPSEPASAEPSPGASVPATGTGCENVVDGSTDLLATICEAGVIRVSTDPNYAPQSFIDEDTQELAGFDIDTAKEVARRLGVEVGFETPVFDAVVAGGWNERWDISVGSVTITEERLPILSFTQPYYYTPAQMSVTEASGITAYEDVAGKRVCVGSSTTYQRWLEGTLALVDAPEPAPPLENVTVVPVETDQLCAQAVASGRFDFEAFLTADPTIQAAIDAGTPIVRVGDPVFFEPLAIAIDKSGPPHEELLTELDRILGEMHADGTLSASSKEWYGGLDYSVTE